MMLQCQQATQLKPIDLQFRTGTAVWVRGNSSNLSFSVNGIYDSSASIDDHLVDTTNVHGITDTSQLATLTTTNSLNTRLISIELGLGIFD
jgi:hypothetical protein